MPVVPEIRPGGTRQNSVRSDVSAPHSSSQPIHRFVSLTLLGATVYGSLKFITYCNMDTPNESVMTLFTSTFEQCIDACASYTTSIPKKFSPNENSRCYAVSFVPAWASRSDAIKDQAPGNCYLKPGPQNESALIASSGNVDRHSAINMGI